MRGTFRHCSIDIPAQKIVLNLAPSDIRKEGTRFDLPLAVALFLLCRDGQLHHKEHIIDGLFFGELGLDGFVKRIDGLLPSVLHALQSGYKIFFIPADNIYELEYIDGIEIYAIDHFQALANHFDGSKELEPYQRTTSIEDLYKITDNFEVDFAYIK